MTFLFWRRVYLKGSEIVIWFWSGHCVKILFYPLTLEYNFLDVSLEIRKENNPNILIMESEMFHVNLLSPIWVVTHGFIIYKHRLYVPFTHSEPWNGLPLASFIFELLVLVALGKSHCKVCL